MGKELKETFYKIEIQKVTNGFIVYVNNTLKHDSVVSDNVFAFNTILKLTEFLLSYKEIEKQ